MGFEPLLFLVEPYLLVGNLVAGEKSILERGKGAILDSFSDILH
jgi:hypothetical protein